MSDSYHTKYRPKTFNEVVGQKSAIRSLKKTLEDGFAHTFLLTGPSGVGKTTIARIIAKAVCGGKATDANILEIDGATHSAVDDMRSVTSSLLYKAIGEIPHKVVICDEVHQLSKSAWNSILKATEEPPPHVYWILCTTEPGKVPDTMKTRCVRHDLKPVSEDDLFILLAHVANKEKLDTSDDMLDAIAENSNGSPRQALVNLEACKFCESTNDAMAIMQTAGRSKEVIDLCRLLVAKQGRSWGAALVTLQALSKAGVEAESVRIVVANYLASVILNTKNDGQAMKLLSILECFSEAYKQTDKYAPLLLSVGIALGLNK
jgi:DNA polymerase-3 subunit gamma/tau